MPMLAHLDQAGAEPAAETADDVLASLAMLRPGDVIGGRYRLVEPLASGGMGAVWKAVHTELSVDVALKVMLSEMAATPSAEARFRREAQAAARLKSPHVVQVTDFGVADGQPYLAMELLQGEDLQTRLEKRGRLSLSECAVVLDGVAKAIQLAHDGHIIHRDLKPANIFLAAEDGREVVKVLDFGVAKVGGPDAVGKTTGSGLVGSPTYMSPEQVWAEPVTSRTDIWSLAVVAYEMVTGTNPFEAPSLAKTFELIVRHELPGVRDALPDLPDSVDAFFVRALERDPEQRFASARELAAAFREAIAGVAVSSHSPAAVAASRRSVDPNGVTVAEQRPAKKSFRAPLVVGAVALAAAGIYVLATAAPEARTTKAGPTHVATGRAVATASSATGDVPPPATLQPSATADAVVSVSAASSPAKVNGPKHAVSMPPVETASAATVARSAQSSVHPKFGIPRATSSN